MKRVTVLAALTIAAGVLSAAPAHADTTRCHADSVPGHPDNATTTCDTYTDSGDWTTTTAYCDGTDCTINN